MPTNPIEAAIRNHMQIDHAIGSIALSDFFTPTARRIGIADHDFFESIFSVFSENATPEQITEYFYQFGLDWGSAFLDRLKTQLKQAAGEHAQRHGLKHRMARAYAGAPILARMHLVECRHVFRRVRIEGRSPRRARG